MARRIRIYHFSIWADQVEEADAFLGRLPQLDLTPRVSNSADPELMRMARLDCDWHGENTRVFASMKQTLLQFLPARVTGIHGLIDLVKAAQPHEEERWLVFDGQTPQKLAGTLPKLMPMLARVGFRTAWYSFDESSRTLSAFKEIAPYLQVLIHDEFPLDPKGRALLNRNCVTLHRSWVANIIPFSVPFNETPEDKILFLGSQLGLTDHRRRQIDFLSQTFGDRFVAIHDHSVSVSERGTLNRYKAALCPEGRKFVTAAMGMTHTDRPFWSGCLGMVPISEDSRNGGRLEQLAEQRLIRRYAHGDLVELKAACERALSASVEDRRKIYDYFNRGETVGAILAAALVSVA